MRIVRGEGGGGGQHLETGLAGVLAAAQRLVRHFHRLSKRGEFF